MGLHAEMPVTAFLCLMHLGVAFTATVPGRGRRGDEGGVHYRASPQKPSFPRQLRVDGVEDGFGRPFLQQPVDLEQRRGIRRGLRAQIDANEAAACLAVVEDVLDPLVGQAKAVLRYLSMYAPGQSAADRGHRPSGRTLRSSPPARTMAYRFEVRQKSIPPHPLLLAGVPPARERSPAWKCPQGSGADNVVAGQTDRGAANESGFPWGQRVCGRVSFTEQQRWRGEACAVQPA